MFQQTIRFGRIWGIQIGVNNSWFIVFLLITFSLSAQYAGQFPQWPAWQQMALGAGTSVLFFVSILLHELGHSAVALRYGIPVKSITLFVFGGIAQMGRDPRRPSEEFQIAIAGPVVSAALGALFYGLLLLSQGRSEALAALGEWLGRINLMVAGFNLLPGFPLDGGRVLRALLWKYTGSFERATLTAAAGGQILAYGFIAAGIWTAFGGNAVGGIWIGLIGWFLLNAAQATVLQLSVQEALAGLRASDVMSSDYLVLPGPASITELLEHHLLRTGGRCAVVAEGGRIEGLVTLHEIKAVPREEWPRTPLRSIMIAAERLITAAPDDTVEQVLRRMSEHNINQIPVVTDGRLAGLIARDRLLALISARVEFGAARPARQ